MASLFARCVPGGYDTNFTVAKALTHASLIFALLGAAGGFMATGYCAALVAMHVLMLISMETSNKGLLKVGGDGRGDDDGEHGKRTWRDEKRKFLFSTARARASGDVNEGTADARERTGRRRARANDLDERERD